jgi:trk system potassium uptake protein TrkA
VHIVVVGCGRVGSELATTLAGAGHTVVIVDKHEASFRRLGESWGGRSVVGLGFDRDTLLAAGITDADALAAVTSGDNSNVLTARIAREYFEVPNVVARIYDPRRAVIYQRLGIPTVATVTWTVDQVIRRLLPDQPVTEWSDSTGRLVLVERQLPSTWVGRPLDALEIPERCRMVSVDRTGSPRLARPGLVGQEGDVVHLAVLKDALDEVNRLLEAGA